MTQLTFESLTLKQLPTKAIRETVNPASIVIEAGIPAPPNLVENVAVHGVRVPPIVYRDDEGHLVCLDGRRRILAAIEADLTSIEVDNVGPIKTYDPVLLSAPIILNKHRSENVPLASEHIDRLFDLGADEDAISAGLGISKANVRNMRRVWVNLIDPWKAPYRTAQVKATVGKAVSTCTPAQQKRLHDLFLEKGKLTARDVLREKTSGEPTTLEMDLSDADLDGLRARARTSAAQFEIDVRAWAKTNVSAAQLLGRLVALMDDFELRDVEMGTVDRVKADESLSAAEKEFFGTAPGLSMLSREWRTEIMDGEVEKQLAGQIAALPRAMQDRLYGAWANDDYLRENFDSAAIKQFATERAAKPEPITVTEQELPPSGDGESMPYLSDEDEPDLPVNSTFIPDGMSVDAFIGEEPKRARKPVTAD